MHEVIESRENWYKHQSQPTRFLSTDTAIKPGPESVGTVAQTVMGRTDSMNEALRYLDTAVLNALQNLVENCKLYLLIEEDLRDWPEVTKYNVKQGIIPMIFWEARSSITDLVEVRRTELPQRHWLSRVKKGTR